MAESDFFPIHHVPRFVQDKGSSVSSSLRRQIQRQVVTWVLQTTQNVRNRA